MFIQTRIIIWIHEHTDIFYAFAALLPGSIKKKKKNFMQVVCSRLKSLTFYLNDGFSV